MNLYHASHTPLPVGRTLRARRSKVKRPAALERWEKIFAPLRPRDKPSRETSFFMASSRYMLEELGGTGEHLYRVLPGKLLHCGDYSWLQRAYELAAHLEKKEAQPSPRQLADIRLWVTNYWAGTPGAGEWEYLSPQMTILKDLNPPLPTRSSPTFVAPTAARRRTVAARLRKAKNP